MNNLRAPVFEDKVIDFITELAQVTDRKISPEDLRNELDAEMKAGEKPAKKGGAKKAPAKKAASKKEAADKAPAKKPAEKKAAAKKPAAKKTSAKKSGEA